MPGRFILSGNARGRRDATARCRWAAILAGGEGQRLKPVTQALTGDDRPKQFCEIIGRGTLFDQSVRRAAAIVPGRHVIPVLTSAHEPFYPKGFHRRFPSAVIQPANRGTAPAVLASILSISRRAPDADIALFAADHYFTDESALADTIDEAFALVRLRPDRIVVLGVIPDHAETDYGWIQAGAAVPNHLNYPAYFVRKFWEKPSPELAEELLQTGCYWNSFITVGSASAFLKLFRRTLPEWVAGFENSEFRCSPELYNELSSADFSRQVLTTATDSLCVLPAFGTGWVDLGNQSRVEQIRANMRHRDLPTRRSA